MTKQMTILLIVVGMLIGAGGCNYLGWGYGGETNSPSLTLEAIQVKENWQSGRDSLIGGGVTMIFNGSGVPSDAESTTGDWAGMYQLESQWGTLIDEGVKRDLPEMGFFGRYGVEIVEHSNWFVSAIGGITFADETHLWTSTLGPPDYIETDCWNTYGLFGGGISHILGNGSYLQIDYDNRRGITAGFGWRF